MYTEAFQLLKETFQQLDKRQPPHVNLHGDLVPRNILLSKDRVFFIDWNTYWEDPFLDLTYFAFTHDFTEEEEQKLLNDYLQKAPTIEEQIRFQLGKKIMLARISMILTTFATPEDNIDTKAPLKEYSHYIRLLAEGGALTPQYFYEVAQLLLQKAKAVKVPIS